MTHSPTKIVHVGLGSWGSNWAKLIVPTVPAVETVAWVDPSPAARDAAVATLGLPADRCFASLDEALAATDAEAIVAPVTLPAHAPVIEAAAAAGKHVLIEKPFAPTAAEARRLSDLAAGAGIILHVSQNYRFFPATITTHRLLAEGQLGAVLSVDIEFNRRITDTHYADVPDILLVDMSIHHWDMLRMLVPSPPAEAAFWTRNPPGSPFTADAAATGMIRFDNGVVATYRGNEVARYPETSWVGNWRIECENGVIAFTGRFGGRERTLEGEAVSVADPGGEPREVPLEPITHFGRAGTLNAFAAAVQGQPIPAYTATAADNVATIALMTAIVDSSRDGGAPTPVAPTPVAHV